MQTTNRRGRQTFAAIAVVICGLIGLAAPLMFDFGTSEFKLGHVTVYAAPGDSYDVTAPLQIGHSSGIILERGTVQLIDPMGGGSPISQSRPPLADGSDRLLIEGGVFTIAGSTRAADQAAVAPGTPLAPLAEVLTILNLESLLVRRSTIKVRLPDGRMEALTDVAGEFAVKRKSQLAARGTGRLRGKEISFEATTQIAPDRRSASVVPLKLRVKSALLDINFDGRLGYCRDRPKSGQ